jgi:hypothetical protein
MKNIEGNLIVSDNPIITELRTDALSSIDGQLAVTNVRTLSTLASPKLSQVTDLILDDLPNLSQLGIDVQNATTIFIGRNRLLQNITFHTQAVDQNFTIASNSNNLASISLPDLLIVGGPLNIACNTGLSNLSLPSLNSIGGTMNILGNTPLNALVLPVLHEIVSGATLLGNAK